MNVLITLTEATLVAMLAAVRKHGGTVKIGWTCGPTPKTVKRWQIYVDDRESPRLDMGDLDLLKQSLIDNGWDATKDVVHCYEDETGYHALSCFRRLLASVTMPDLDVPVYVIDKPDNPMLYILKEYSKD